MIKNYFFLIALFSFFVVFCSKQDKAINAIAIYTYIKNGSIHEVQKPVYEGYIALPSIVINEAQRAKLDRVEYVSK